MEIVGKIHSIESFGTVDGPGIRFVTFMQGCPLRCAYCHNPDTWDIQAQTKYEYTPSQLFDEAMRYKNFIKSGGVTLTGGEPLMQPDFVREYFRLCQEAGVHTALDTAGSVITEKTLSVLDYTNLVLLDIKALDAGLCKKVSGSNGQATFRFLDELQSRNIPTWIRHVVVPTLTDNDTSIKSLIEYLKPYNVVEKIEWLPYHTLGVFKYKELGIPYPLEGIEPLDKKRIEEIKKMQQFINRE
ncbi:MAG: pyruvate formate lyase-activating protein [Bacteroidales bacterium]|nr:pyruvate formate lyase-activating protein [Bacteroidales bacterium]MBQ7819392.1 pyruvate formate lyase-activating protein [Bacteroidales bacterium]